MSLYFGGSDSGGRVLWRIRHEWGYLQNRKIKMCRTIILPDVMGNLFSRVARQWVCHSGVRVPLRARDFLLQNARTVSGVYPAANTIGMGYSGRSVKLPTHVCPVPRLRMSGAMPRLLWAVVAWRGHEILCVIV